MMERMDASSEEAEPDDVADAVYHALFDDQPKMRYMVVPNQKEAEWTIKKAIQELVQLNEGHVFSYVSRIQPVGAFDRRQSPTPVHHFPEVALWAVALHVKRAHGVYSGLKSRMKIRCGGIEQHLSGSRNGEAGCIAEDVAGYVPLPVTLHGSGIKEKRSLLRVIRICG